MRLPFLHNLQQNSRIFWLGCRLFWSTAIILAKPEHVAVKETSSKTCHSRKTMELWCRNSLKWGSLFSISVCACAGSPAAPKVGCHPDTGGADKVPGFSLPSVKRLHCKPCKDLCEKPSQPMGIFPTSPVPRMDDIWIHVPLTQFWDLAGYIYWILHIPY